jgi:hypothetical protein
MEKQGKLHPIAVLVGFAVDMAGSTILGLLILFVLLLVWSLEGVKPADMSKKMMSVNEDPMFQAVTGAVGLGFTLIGGYVAGRMAAGYKVLHGAAVGLMGMVLGVFAVALLLLMIKNLPDWYVAVNFLTPIPVAALGGYVATFHRKEVELEDDRLD